MSNDKIASLSAQPPKRVILEDSQATIQVAEKGYSKVLRHLPRTHIISLAWVSEVVGSSDCVLLYVRSEQQAADIFTKAFSSAEKFKSVRELVGMCDPQTHPLAVATGSKRDGSLPSPVFICVPAAVFGDHPCADPSSSPVAMWASRSPRGEPKGSAGAKGTGPAVRRRKA